MTRSELGVALTRKACPACGNTFAGDIVLNTVLSEARAAKVEKLDGQVVGFELCKNCREKIDEGYVILVEIDQSQSQKSSTGMMKPQDAYRTGVIVYVRSEVFSQIFGSDPPSGGIAFVEPTVVAYLSNLAEGSVTDVNLGPTTKG